MNAIYRWLAGGVMFASLLITACNEPSVIGSELLPSEDDIITAVTDTFTVRTYTVREDSSWALNLITYPLGSMDDPVMGKTMASMYTQLRLPANDINLGNPDTLFLDSAVLALRLFGVYGDTLSKFDLEVYRMTEQIESATNYYASQKFGIQPASVGRKLNFTANTVDSFFYYNFIESPQVRIPLDFSFGTELLNLSGTESFSNDSAFLAYLPGLYVASFRNPPASTALLEVNTRSILSRVQLFYHSENVDSLFFELPIGLNALNTGHYEHNFDGFELGDALENPSADKKDSVLFLDPLGGTKARIEIPNLDDLGNVAINKATLTFTLTHGSQSEVLYPPPPNAQLIASDSAGQNDYFLILREDEVYFSIRDQLEGETHYGGILQDVEDDGTGFDTQIYEFNITRHVQAILNGDVENNGMYLMTFPYFRNPERAIVGGAGHPDDRFAMKLNILYTEIQ